MRQWYSLSVVVVVHRRQKSFAVHYGTVTTGCCSVVESTAKSGSSTASGAIGTTMIAPYRVESRQKSCRRFDVEMLVGRLDA